MSLETDRLILRDFAQTDEMSFIEMNKDPSFQRFYSELDCSISCWKELVSLFVAEKFEVPRKNYNLAITLKSSTQFIGCAGIRLMDNQQASVGCALDENFQRGG